MQVSKPKHDETCIESFMNTETPQKPCPYCSERAGAAFKEDITMAFQPIFDISDGSVFAQEALVRGKDGRSAGQILDLVTEDNRYQFDQLCRATAITVASAAGLNGRLSINFMPNAVYEPRNCIQHTLRTAEKCKFDITNLVFEFTEQELIKDPKHLINIIETYKQYGFLTAIDDFGAGFSSLKLLVDVVPDLIKLDRYLIIDIDKDPVRQKIVAHMIALCADLGVTPVVEGVETPQELELLRSLGVKLVQGFLLASPQLEALQTEMNARPY